MQRRRPGVRLAAAWEAVRDLVGRDRASGPWRHRRAAGEPGASWTASSPITRLRLDAKGRVSIPAPFRAVLARDGFEGLYCYPTLDRPALDAGGNALLAEIEALIARFPPYSEEREQFSAALYGTSEMLKIDGEGRVSPDRAAEDACRHPDAVAFVGLGHKFQIWEPGRFRAELAEATEKVRALKKQLGSRVAAEGPHGARE